MEEVETSVLRKLSTFIHSLGTDDDDDDNDGIDDGSLGDSR